VAAQLRATFDSAVTQESRAVAGWRVVHEVNDLDTLLAKKPHLVIVAYGMNDVGRRDPKWICPGDPGPHPGARRADRDDPGVADAGPRQVDRHLVRHVPAVGKRSSSR
jgi:hypothetical protein